jgi:hypothetical protein
MTSILSLGLGSAGLIILNSFPACGSAAKPAPGRTSEDRNATNSSLTSLFMKISVEKRLESDCKTAFPIE